MDLKEAINKRQLSVEVKTNSVDNCNPMDQLFRELQDLVNPQFKAWYCKMFYKLGRDKVIVLASLARADGYDQRRYFSKLLKQA